MKHRYLGQAGVAVSAIGLGCMGMSEFYGASDDGDSLRTLARAVELGVSLFDTADTYGFGHNESLLGRFLADGGAARRARVRISTKFGIVREAGCYERRIDNSPGYVRAACEASLRRLGVEHIDLYFCHRRHPEVPLEDMVGAMGDLVKAGKVGQIGLSEVSAETLRRAHAVHPVAAVQSEYSLWSREPEEGVLAACAEIGASFIAYSPLGRAFLTGRLKLDELAEGDFRRANPRFEAEAAAINRRLVDGLTEFAARHRASNAQIALAWLLAKHPHVIPIPGTRRPDRLAENMAAADLMLSSAELAELDALFHPEQVAGARYPEAGMAGIE
ncbi:aldo/keto reductase [Zoogloea sp.]|jgi:aryl-alcohol dehydrogenase-like predicted oxidoreductase|uniref:aldo/keto reductase n=1 Tax=Zoogloea sp. TaxID=49181 RepID=UPI0037DA6A40